MKKTSQIKSDGTLFTSVSLDEVAQSTISENQNYLRAAEFDEVTISPLSNGLVRRKTNNGRYLVAKEFDEVTKSFVNDSLVMYFDTAETASYSGTGSTLNDLSGNGRNATLYNTPTYKGEYGGLLSYDDDTFEYAETAAISDLNRWTAEVWVRFNAAIGTKVTSVVTNQFDLGSKLNFSIGTNRAPASYNITAGFFDGAWRNATGFAASTNTWYHLVGTYDGSYVRFYVNGSENSNLQYTGTPQSGGTVRIARRWDGNTIVGNHVDGDIPVVRIYSRALNAEEVLQNFNASKSRYGL